MKPMFAKKVGNISRLIMDLLRLVFIKCWFVLYFLDFLGSPDNVEDDFPQLNKGVLYKACHYCME